MRSECRAVEDFAGRFDHMDKSIWELEISFFLGFTFRSITSISTTPPLTMFYISAKSLFTLLK
jgi:hypothetical protein